ncbi:TrbI F-type domain-containing protein [Parasphingorhabdus sp.]|uniref:TrbI F-type domain-containing protein n=1 Tax=Parasphingorhabdus sp. TaxID=2709688 RepID=UPI003BB0BBD7
MNKHALERRLVPSIKSIGAVLVVVAAILWIIWVSISLTRNQKPEIMQVRLSEIMNEFVDAEARKDGDPEVTRETIARYLKIMEDTVADMSREGRVMIVSEAIVSPNTPDATPLLKQRIAQKLAQGSGEKRK